MRDAVFPVLSTLVLVLTLACSSGRSGSQPPIPPTAPSIATQPISQTVSVGVSTTLNVVASGSEPLSYQWKWNNAVITGATSSSFTTPIAVSADNGSTFNVTVTNSQGTVTSNAATLTVNGAPRAPLQGDLRFKDVDAFPFGLTPMSSNGEIIAGGIIMSMSAKNATCTPLNISYFNPAIPHSNAWNFYGFSLPSGYPGRDFSGTGGWFSSLESDLSALNPQTVITSLDMDSLNLVYGMTWVRTSQNQIYTPVRQAVPLSGLQDAATLAGTHGQVITAISFMNGQPYFVAYAWSGDSGNQYEVQVAQAGLDSISTAVSNLAASGYIITAMGGNYTDGYLLIGTRLKGDSTVRPVSIIQSPPWSLGRGYAPIGWIIINGSSYLSIGQQ